MIALPLLLLLAATTQDPALKDLHFVQVPADTYTVGEKDHPQNPRRQVTHQSFEIATTEVTNAQFTEFIKATDYVTDAERNGFGMTFKEGMKDWEWHSTPGATWRKPFGPDEEGIENKPTHPVTQISFQDAQAFCDWAGLRLPTIEEWEVAARAGEPARWPWGDQYTPKEKYRANTWQGKTHHKNLLSDGHQYTAPVAQFPPNAWGLYDVIGNVFEYCIDERLRNPEGILFAAGRGGSWWCSTGTCNFFNLVDIGQMHPNATLPNQGFRVVRDTPKIKPTL
jgi:sulfatase modifying factor 1